MGLPRFLSDLAGTLRATLQIGKATLNASGLSVARTLALPDADATLVPSSLAEVNAIRLPLVVCIDDDTSLGSPPQLIDIFGGGIYYRGGCHVKRTTGDVSYGYYNGIVGCNGADDAGMLFFLAVDRDSVERKVLMHDAAPDPENTIITPTGQDLFVEPGMCVWLRYFFDFTLANPGYWVVDSVVGEPIQRTIGGSFERAAGVESAVISVPTIAGFSGEIVGWKIKGRSGENGTATFDVRKNDVSIVGSAPPEITADNDQSGTPDGSWTKTFSAGDAFTFVTTAVSDFSQVSIALYCKES